MAAEVVKALETVLRQPVDLAVAGRTDRGVHALGQVISYPARCPSLRSVNAVLPHEIAVVAAEEVPEGFSARRDAKSRTYIYRVLARRQPSPFERGRALWWPHNVDEDALHACARGARRHPRLHGLHAHRDLPHALHARRVTAPNGCATATSSSSTSRPTRSCAT